MIYSYFTSSHSESVMTCVRDSNWKLLSVLFLLPKAWLSLTLERVLYIIFLCLMLSIHLELENIEVILPERIPFLEP